MELRPLKRSRRHVNRDQENGYELNHFSRNNKDEQEFELDLESDDEEPILAFPFLAPSLPRCSILKLAYSVLKRKIRKRSMNNLFFFLKRTLQFSQ